MGSCMRVVVPCEGIDVTARDSVTDTSPGPIKGRIAVVGACASGKSVLVSRLCALGYDARQCAQEHSYVGDMWQRLSRPEVLVYLHVSHSVLRRRRRVDFNEDYLQEQLRRLEHSRRHCDVYVDTDDSGEDEVLAKVIAELDDLGLRPRMVC